MTAEIDAPAGKLGAVSFSATGAFPQSVSDSNAVRFISGTGGGDVEATASTLILGPAGTETFTLEYRASDPSVTFQIRSLLVVPLN